MTTIITYEQMKNFYEEFKQNLPEDKFLRYWREVELTRNLIKSAKKQGLEKDVFEYQKIQDEAVNQLRSLGYKIKD